MTEEQQRAWVAALREGDERAFEEIYVHYKQSLFYLAWQLVGNPQEAEDVLQESFIKAFRSLSGLRKPKHLDAWLRRIVYRTGLDFLRRRKRLAETSLDEGLQRHSRSRPFADPAKEALLNERIDLVQEAMQRMNPRYRTHLILREVEGLNYEQIGEILNESNSVVRTTIFRARQQLRQLVQEANGEEQP